MRAGGAAHSRRAGPPGEARPRSARPREQRGAPGSSAPPPGGGAASRLPRPHSAACWDPVDGWCRQRLSGETGPRSRGPSPGLGRVGVGVTSDQPEVDSHERQAESAVLGGPRRRRGLVGDSLLVG